MPTNALSRYTSRAISIVALTDGRTSMYEIPVTCETAPPTTLPPTTKMSETMKTAALTMTDETATPGFSAKDRPRAKRRSLVSAYMRTMRLTSARMSQTAKKFTIAKTASDTPMTTENSNRPDRVSGSCSRVTIDNRMISPKKSARSFQLPSGELVFAPNTPSVSVSAPRMARMR